MEGSTLSGKEEALLSWFWLRPRCSRIASLLYPTQEGGREGSRGERGGIHSPQIDGLYTDCARKQKQEERRKRHLLQTIKWVNFCTSVVVSLPPFGPTATARPTRPRLCPSPSLFMQAKQIRVDGRSCRREKEGTLHVLYLPQNRPLFCFPFFPGGSSRSLSACST